MVGIIPYKIVWGGHLKSPAQKKVFEITSIIMVLVMIMIVGTNAAYFKINLNRKIILVLLWILFAFFIFNSIGNLFSRNLFERLVFTPFTLLISILCFRLAIGKK